MLQIEKDVRIAEHVLYALQNILQSNLSPQGRKLAIFILRLQLTPGAKLILQKFCEEAEKCQTVPPFYN